MAVQSFSQWADRVISRIAARQHGVVERQQLLEAGVTRHQIVARLASGRLVELHRGVYLVGAVASPHAHEMAALLAYDLRAALSHRSASALWSLLPYPATAPVWITIPPERNASRPRIKAIRASLDPGDIRERHGMPLTSPPRTLLDMAALLEIDELESLVAEAHFRGKARDSELRHQIERNPHKRGVATLRRVLDLPGGPKRTRSPAERWMLRLLRDRGITGYETNARIHGFEVDFSWPEVGLVIEVDGYDAHSGRVAFERDHLKRATLTAHGLHVMPVTGRQIKRDPDGVVKRLLRALAALESRNTD
jgi:very-short-patch-repair endonuclease